MKSVRNTVRMSTEVNYRTFVHTLWQGTETQRLWKQDYDLISDLNGFDLVFCPQLYILE